MNERTDIFTVEAVAPAVEPIDFSDIEALEESFAMACTEINL